MQELKDLKYENEQEKKSFFKLVTEKRAFESQVSQL